MKKNSGFLSVLLPGLVIGGLAVAGLVTPDARYSESERRVLAKFPKVKAETVIDGQFMTDFEAYTLDQFVGRDTWRSIKAAVSHYILGQKDNNGLYMANGHISKLEYPLNKKRVKQSLELQKKVYETYIKDTDCKVYQSVIPDKNSLLAPENGYPHIDYEAYYAMVKAGTPYAEYIDITDLVQLDDFYKTDQHWKQENILDVAERIGSAMGASSGALGNGGSLENSGILAAENSEKLMGYYEVKTVDTPFYGAYYSQAALPHEPDTMKYLTNEVLENCIVTSFNTGTAKPAKMYDMDKAAGRDPYEMFLSGSDALIVIENPLYGADAEGGNPESVRMKQAAPGLPAEVDGPELVIFRDSFGSSLVPLLVPGYAKITLVDLRYIKPELIGQFIEFGDQDVLFMYSSLIY